MKQMLLFKSCLVCSFCFLITATILNALMFYEVAITFSLVAFVFFINAGLAGFYENK